MAKRVHAIKKVRTPGIQQFTYLFRHLVPLFERNWTSYSLVTPPSSTPAAIVCGTGFRERRKWAETHSTPECIHKELQVWFQFLHQHLRV